MNKPSLFIVSGPGGVGKTTVIKTLLKRIAVRKKIIKSVSYTTRPKRPGEVNGRDYCFVSENKFLSLAKAKFFLETEKVSDYYYGTPRKLLELAQKQHKACLLCIDVKGGMNLKRSLKDCRITSIFIWASLKAIQQRFKKRGDDRFIVYKRTALAKKEMRYKNRYDYRVKNVRLKQAVEEIAKIINTQN